MHALGGMHRRSHMQGAAGRMGAAAETTPKPGCGSGSVLAHGWTPRQSVCLPGAWYAAWGPPETVAGRKGAASEVGRGGAACVVFSAPGELWGPCEGPQVRMHTRKGVHRRCRVPGAHCAAAREVGRGGAACAVYPAPGELWGPSHGPQVRMHALVGVHRGRAVRPVWLQGPLGVADDAARRGRLTRGPDGPGTILGAPQGGCTRHGVCAGVRTPLG
jgi:hypothetical protein